MAEENNNALEAAADGAQQAGPQFALQRIYLKDTSFESPKSPQIFQTQGAPRLPSRRATPRLPMMCMKWCWC